MSAASQPASATGRAQQQALRIAQQQLLARLDAVQRQCQDGFPLYSSGTDDRWTVSAGGSWVGGFWAGCWWQRARSTGAPGDQARAWQICQRLAPRLEAASVNRAMLFWYGPGLGAQGFGHEAAAPLAGEAARALALSRDEPMRCLPLGPDMGGGADGGRRISVDTLAPIVELLGHFGAALGEQVAREHVDTLVAACMTQEGAWHAGARYVDGAFVPEGQAGNWSRGQAWAMLGLSAAARRWGGRYTQLALAACACWHRTRAHAPPPDRLHQPAGMADPSAAVIAALAMLDLAALPGEAHGGVGEDWEALARQQVAAVLEGPCFVPQTDGTAIFWGGCYQVRPGVRELVESPWSSFLLLEVLWRLEQAPGDRVKAN